LVNTISLNCNKEIAFLCRKCIFGNNNIKSTFEKYSEKVILGKIKFWECLEFVTTRQEKFDNIRTFDLTKIVSLMKSLINQKAIDRITVYPRNAKQKSLLKSLLEEMKVRFEIATTKDETLLSESDFFAKIDKSIDQAANGNTKPLSKEKQKEFLGL
jgi:hypothetical protein